MRKIIITGVVMMLMAITVLGSPSKGVGVLINDHEHKVPSDMGKIFIDNQARTQVPLRFISERLGHKVNWNDETQQVDIDNGAVIVTIGEKTIKANGKTIKIDTEPVTLKGRTYVPVRFIAEALGHKVEYRNISGKNAIMINTSGEVPEIPKEDKEKPADTGSNYNPGNTNTYKHRYSKQLTDVTKHWVTSSSIGSNSENTKTRTPGTSHFNDIAHLNSMVGNTNYGFAADGQLTIANGRENTHLNVSRGSSNSWVSIGYVPGTETRSVEIKSFIPKYNKDPGKDRMSQHNIIIESIKYFSNTAEDGLAITSYISSFVDKDEQPPVDKLMTFGSTDVLFRSNAGWGVTVIFQK